MSIISASYRGVPLAVTDVIAGVIDLAFADFSVAIPQMQGGTLRGIGVTSPKRNELTPDLPAARRGHAGLRGHDLVRAAGARRTRRSRSSTGSTQRAKKSCRRRRCAKKLASLGMVVSPMPPAEFGAFIRSEITRWTADAKAAGIEAK